ncbi:hypothetical protein [Streptomyces sp. NPDC058240]
MRTESTDIITHVYGDMEPDHTGDHDTPYDRSSWDRPGRSWPAN